MAKDDKLKALDAAIAQIERQYGKGSVSVSTIIYQVFSFGK